MKVLFLDIDGVLNSHVTRATYGNEYIDPDIIYILNNTLIHTGCKVVISSSWKAFLSLSLVTKILTDAGLDEGLIIGATPNLSYQFYNRGDEIQQWLDNHKVEAFAILDDECDMSDDLSKYLVRTDLHKGMCYQDSHVVKHILDTFKDLIFNKDVNYFTINSVYKVINTFCESCGSDTFIIHHISSNTRFILYISLYCYTCSYIQDIITLRSKKQIHNFIKTKTIDI